MSTVAVPFSLGAGASTSLSLLQLVNPAIKAAQAIIDTYLKFIFILIKKLVVNKKK
ncbi:hypothetical protein [Bacteroides sp. 224]|uniref:hypothetical protein n=1 Tax=Bacteroides sp. 224 TaxID=2302936 RepID=UPI0013D7BA20|nr:hypothetical protein [Bacteroides sp. 224]